nr:phage virion morphogenesis protein [Variovorax sp. YR216]
MTADDPLSVLEDWVAPLLARLTPPERRALARKVGQDLRRSQASRIAAQRNPDGSTYEPRKPGSSRQQQGRIRRTMFNKLRTVRFLRLQASEEAVAIGFLGRPARIARVHQEGLRDAVKPGGAQYQYPARTLLGFTDFERERIRELLLAHIAD